MERLEKCAQNLIDFGMENQEKANENMLLVLHKHKSANKCLK
jgi:hypothetical protein